MVQGLAPAFRRTPPYWSLFDAVLIALTSMMAVQLCVGGLATVGLFVPSKSPEFAIPVDPLAGSVAVTTGQWMTMVFITYLLSRRGQAIDAIGWRPRTGDVSLGLLWSLLLIPPVLIFAALVNHFLKDYQHQTLDLLRAETSVAGWAILFIGTGVCTPITEEFLFRGILQGAFERLGMLRRLRSQLLATRNSRQRSELLDDHLQQLERGDIKPPILAVFGSSLVFAAGHIGQGYAFIPLFFFALGLGWLFQRTGSLWPGIVVHAMLNLLTLASVLTYPDVA